VRIVTDPTRDTDGRTGRPARSLGWFDTAAQYAWRGLVILVALTAVIYVATRLYLVTLPVILALILATLCVPPARRLQRLGMPRILAATAMPAASSAALLMRLPEAKRSMAFSRSDRFSDKIREAVIEEMLVLTTTLILLLPINLWSDFSDCLDR
jgi:hypothetical protein